MAVGKSSAINAVQLAVDLAREITDNLRVETFTAADHPQAGLTTKALMLMGFGLPITCGGTG